MFVFHPHPGDGLLNEHVGSELCKDKNPWMDQRGMAQAATSSWSVWFLVGNGGMGYWDYSSGAQGTIIGIHSSIPYYAPGSGEQLR